MRGFPPPVAAIAAAGFILASLPAPAQTRDTSVPYLRAAIGSLSLRDRVTFKGVYDGQAGLQEATGRHLRGKGYSRFVVSDPESGVTFDMAYCLQNSKVFSDLLAVRGRQVFIFHGYKDRGEDKDDAVIVTQVERVGVETAVPGEGAAKTPARTFRVTLTDLSTSNRTVIVNVETGKPYRLMDAQIVIEEETFRTPGP